MSFIIPISSLEDCKENNDILKLLYELNKGESSAKEKGWLSIEDIKNHFDLSNYFVFSKKLYKFIYN